MELDDLRYASKHLEDLRTQVKYVAHYFDVVTSTQDVAREMAERGAPEGTVVLAEEMVAGKGRLGRKWHAGRGGLWMTIVLRPSMPPRKAQLLSIMSSVAVVEAVGRALGIKLGIKWPNDILFKKRKVSGVLIETSISGDRVDYSLVGIGINVNNEVPLELKQTAVSLKELVGAPVPRIPLLCSLLESFDVLYYSLRRGDETMVINRWKAHSATIGKRVRVVCWDNVLEGLAIGIAGDGSLLLKADDGSILVVNAGEVVHLR